MDKCSFKTDRFGKLDMKEVFLFFEEPLVFSCSDANGDCFLFSKQAEESYAVCRITDREMYFRKERKSSISELFLNFPENTYQLSGKPNVGQASIQEYAFTDGAFKHFGVHLCS